MAGRLPQEFIDELMQRVDIVDVIERRVPLKKKGREYGARCPFHDEKTPSFTVSAEKQFYHCFGCGAHGTALGFLMEYENMGFREAVEELAQQVGLELPKDAAPSEPAEDTRALGEILSLADQHYRRQLRQHPAAAEAIDYLKARGLSGEIAAEFGLGYAPDSWSDLLDALGRDDAARQLLMRAGLVVQKDNGSFYDRFRHRIMFPIHDYRGRIVGFGGRGLGDTQPKYLNSPETALFQKGRELYGLHHGRDAIKQAQRVVVVEGYMDVVALAQFGIRFAVATLGTATTHQHLERVFRFAPELVFCFDGDRAGREAAWRALENALPVLREGRQVSFLFLPEGEDPDSLVRKEGHEAFRARLEQAQPLPDYLFEALSQKVDLGRLDGRARLVELARPLLAKLPAGVFRQMMLQRLAEISRTDGATLAANLAPAPAQSGARRAPARRGGAPKPLRHSLVRQAVALLVQNPRLAALAGDPQGFAALDIPGVQLLCNLIELLNKKPDLNTATIIEHFRPTEHGPALEKLAIWQHMVGAEGTEAEFQDALYRLETMAVDQLTDALLAKDQLEGLTDEEKRRLLQLYRDKQQLQGRLART